MLSFSPAVLPKYHYEAPQTPKHIILHYCAFKTFWDWFILSLIIYTAIFVPYHVAFSVGMNDRTGWLYADSIVDLIFIADVAINFHTTYVGQGGEVISDPKIIRTNYIKSWFIIDLLACLPYDLIDMVNFFYDNRQNESGCDLLSALKIARLLRLGHVVRKLDHYIEYGGAMLFLLVCFFGLSAHWLACIWYTIGRSNLKGNNNQLVNQNWLVILSRDTNRSFNITDTEHISGGPSVSQCYIAALYFTMTGLTSVGFGNVAGNTESEQIFCVVMLIFGSLLYACIFGNITTIIQQMYADTNRYHDRLTSVREFLRLYHVPKELSNRIMDYVVSTWSITKGIDTSQVLNYFPKDMKADICVHLGRETFTKQSAFSLASNSCLRALAVEFETSHNAPGDMIVHKGESIEAINFVVSGSLEVIQDDEVVAILSKGDVFGDVFWNGEPPASSESHVRALTYCDLHSIGREPLLRILDFYKSFALSFARKMLLTFNLTTRFRFRKVDDVHREREQNEIRSKREEVFDESDFPENHPIRMVIRRFKNRIRERQRNEQIPGKKNVSTSTMTSSTLPDAVRSVADQNSFDDVSSRFRLSFDEEDAKNVEDRIQRSLSRVSDRISAIESTLAAILSFVTTTSSTRDQKKLLERSGNKE